MYFQKDRELNNAEARVLEENKGKVITWNFIEDGKGYIQDAVIFNGTFCYLVSKARKPRTEFSMDSANWSIVSARYIMTINTPTEIAIIESDEETNALLQKMKDHLLTPAGQRGSFTHREILDKINEIRAKINKA